MTERQIGINHRVGYRTPDINLNPPDEPLDRKGNVIIKCCDCGYEICQCDGEDY